MLAEGGGHLTILQMLAQRERDGPLAEFEVDLHQVNLEFKATVINFKCISDIYQHDAKESDVGAVLRNPCLERDKSDGGLSLRRLHLPENKGSVVVVDVEVNVG
jgi:hypothetical protein